MFTPKHQVFILYTLLLTFLSILPLKVDIHILEGLYCSASYLVELLNPVLLTLTFLFIPF